MLAPGRQHAAIVIRAPGDNRPLKKIRRIADVHLTSIVSKGSQANKTHVEHNETALTLIADIPGDMDVRCNGPRAEVVNGTSRRIFDSAQ